MLQFLYSVFQCPRHYQSTGFLLETRKKRKGYDKNLFLIIIQMWETQVSISEEFQRGDMKDGRMFKGNLGSFVCLCRLSRVQNLGTLFIRFFVGHFFLKFFFKIKVKFCLFKLLFYHP